MQWIPHEKQFIRVLLGMLVSIMHLVLLTLVRPYKRQDVFVVAFGLQAAAALTFCMALCVLQYTSLQTIESEAAPRLLGFDTVDSMVVTMISINLATLGAGHLRLGNLHGGGGVSGPSRAHADLRREGAEEVEAVLGQKGLERRALEGDLAVARKEAE